MKSRRDSPHRRNFTLQIPKPPSIPSLTESIKSTPEPTPHCHRFDLSDFNPLDLLGDHGIPGTAIYKAVHRPTGDLYALLVISKDKPEHVRRFIYNHATAMCKIRAPNIVNYFDVFHAAPDKEVCIIMEYVSGESLLGKQISDEKELSFVAEQILRGLHDMHTQKRVHRNLCPENFMIGHRADTGGSIKVAEFGCSLSTWNGDLYSDMAYMSPERINTDLTYGMYNGYAGDVWSFGICVMELYMGRHPFHLHNPGDFGKLVSAIHKTELPPQLPPCASSELRDFVTSCLQKDIEKRWTAAALLKHPFILSNKQRLKMIT